MPKTRNRLVNLSGRATSRAGIVTAPPAPAPAPAPAPVPPSPPPAPAPVPVPIPVMRPTAYLRIVVRMVDPKRSRTEDVLQTWWHDGTKGEWRDVPYLPENSKPPEGW